MQLDDCVEFDEVDKVDEVGGDNEVEEVDELAAREVALANAFVKFWTIAS